MAAKPTKAPASVRVGAFTFSVVTKKRELAKHDVGPDKANYGKMDPEGQMLLVDASTGPDQTRDTMLHEVLHAGWSVYHLPGNKNAEEEMVRRLTPVLIGILRDNPDLVAYLTA